MALNLSLARKYDTGLWPRTLADEGRAFQRSLGVMTEAEEPVITALLHRRVFPEAQRRAAKAADAGERFKKRLAVLEGALAGRPYLLGEAFTVADLNVASVLAWAPLVSNSPARRMRTTGSVAAPGVRPWRAHNARSGGCYRAPGAFTTNVAREWSAIRKVGWVTATTSWQRGHCGFILLPSAPSRYERGAWQCGHGPNHAYAMSFLPSSGSADD